MNLLDFLWPFEAGSVFAAFVFFFLMFVFSWAFVGFLASLIILLCGLLEEVAS